MAVRLLRSSNGDVLKSSNGRVLKANHNFGKAFTGAGRLDFSAGDQPSFADTTICFWSCLDIAGAYHRVYAGGTEVIRNGTLNGATNWYTTYPSLSNTNHYSGIHSGRAFHCIRISEVDIKAFVNMGTQLKTANTTVIAAINALLLSAGCGFSDYYFFDRLLSDNEISFLFNNRLGNEPVTLEGCKAAIDMEKAEILDFSAAKDGSLMKVGMRGIIHNKHIEITGLPAGTLQEQVNYANANLFRPFI